MGDIWLVDVQAPPRATERTRDPGHSLELDSTFSAARGAVSLCGKGLAGDARDPRYWIFSWISSYQGDRDARPKALKQAGRRGAPEEPHKGEHTAEGSLTSSPEELGRSLQLGEDLGDGKTDEKEATMLGVPGHPSEGRLFLGQGAQTGQAGWLPHQGSAVTTVSHIFS